MTLIRGVPGSGKSTYASKLLTLNFEADNYFIRPDGFYEFNANSLKHAHEWCYDCAAWHVLRGEFDVSVSNTFTRIWEMQRYIDLAKANGYELEVVRCTGRYPNIHGVPESTVQKMLDRFEDYEGEILK